MFCEVYDTETLADISDYVKITELLDFKSSLLDTMNQQ